MTDRISGSAFKQMIAFGAACVAQQKQAINDLNVFPVPDGDTLCAARMQHENSPNMS